MNRRMGWLGVIGVLCCVWSAGAMAPRRFAVSLLVVPARHTVVQVANDVLAHRPVVLVAYQASEEDGSLALHVWNIKRSTWHPISMEDFRGTTFMRQRPDRIVLVGSSPELPTDPLPAELRDATSWSRNVIEIDTLATTPLLNRLSEVFSFTNKEQAWFAARYQRGLVDLNAQQRGRSWYDQPLDEFLENEKN